jgi:hypothetical protein
LEMPFCNVRSFCLWLKLESAVFTVC